MHSTQTRAREQLSPHREVRRSILLLAADLAKLAAQQFGTGEEKDDSLPSRVMAEDVMRFGRSKSFLVCWQTGHSG